MNRERWWPLMVVVGFLLWLAVLLAADYRDGITATTTTTSTMTTEWELVVP